jgi:pyrroloquinoline quinone biosynthesis protein E
VTISEALIPSSPSSPARKDRPLGLLAEVTYRCPLHCPYCSNPTQYPPTKEELSSEEWARVFQEAAELGVLHALFSGGEPLLRRDLEVLVRSAREAGLYTNLITSGVGLSSSRLLRLQDAGLDSVQISLQSSQAPSGNLIAGAPVHEAKLDAARHVRSAGLPLTLNVVLHRGNLSNLGEIVDLAVELGAERLELAHTQFYGWALKNRDALLPTRAQVEEASRIAASAKIRLRGKMELLYVLPDYYGERPKPCMNGWGRRYLTVNSVGDVLPCPTAGEIKSLTFETVRRHPLRWIWEESEAFRRFRGTQWMPEPCQTCPEWELDHGGCRCQAALLTGDPTRTDPACALSPDRETLRAILGAVDPARASFTEPNSEGGLPWVLQYRSDPKKVDPIGPEKDR